MDYSNWKFDHKMLYLSAYFQVGWLNVQDLWLVVHNSKGSQWQPRPQTYAILSQKRICHNLCAFWNNKCPLFIRLGGGVAERGKCHLFLQFFFIARLPLELFVQYTCLISGLISKKSFFPGGRCVIDMLMIIKWCLISTADCSLCVCLLSWN